MSRRYVCARRGASPQHDMGLADFGPPERWQHSPFVLVANPHEMGGGAAQAAKALEECALDRWLKAGGLTKPEYEAGMRFRADYQHSAISLLASRVYDGVRGPSPGAAWSSPAERRSPAQEQAYKRWRQALAEVKAGEVVQAVLKVCCEDGQIGWQRRHLLQEGLQALQQHYRL
jgi:hypothetical protein